MELEYKDLKNVLDFYCLEVFDVLYNKYDQIVHMRDAKKILSNDELSKICDLLRNFNMAHDRLYEFTKELINE